MASDCIRLTKMVFTARHGVHPHEKVVPARFEVDVEVRKTLDTAAMDDTIGNTLDYGAVYETVRSVMDGPSRDLIETLAGEICERVLAGGGCECVVVRVRKMNPPLPGAVECAEVELRRERDADGISRSGK